MPKPKKRSKSKASQAPAKKAPAGKKPPAQKPLSEMSYDEKMSSLIEGANKIKGSESFLLTDDNLEMLWSRPTYFVSTRSLALDRALGVPGLPGGRLVEVYGENSAGKSTLVDQVLAECQAMGGVAIKADQEEATDLKYARAVGVDTDKLVNAQCTTMETVFANAGHYAEEARAAFGPGVPIVFAWDSVAGTPTAEELAGDAGDQYRASAAKVIKQNLRRLMQTFGRTQTLFLCVNQVYKRMQSGGKRTFFSDDDETYGGGGIKYHASIRIALFKKRSIYPRGFTWDGRAEGERVPDPIGQETGAKVVKNKLAAPNKYRNLALLYGYGTNNGFSMYEDFVEAGLIHKGGNGWSQLDQQFGETEKWQSREGQAWFGLNDIINATPGLWPKLVGAYKALP